MAKIFNEENFEEEVLKSDMPVLVDFYADWCGPCKMFAPILEEVEEDYVGKIKIGKDNIDQNEGITAEYKIMSVPTTLIFRDGTIVNTLIGVQPEESIREALDSVL